MSANNNNLPKNLQLEIAADVAKGTYSNLAIITHSPTEIILDFAQMLPGVKGAAVRERILMNPIHAKRLLNALAENINRAGFRHHHRTRHAQCHQHRPLRPPRQSLMSDMTEHISDLTIERHTLMPFLPSNARLLMLGSFPPPRKRWCMDFFYPNRTNQMWLIFGEVFFNDSQRFVDVANKTFLQKDIEALLREKGIAIFDTATAVRRLSGNASDKDLEIVERTDIRALLSQIPACHDIVCTGQKSFSALTEEYGAVVPVMGQYSEFSISGRPLRLWRMPSSSRAYPMPLAQKAEYYRQMMRTIGLG